MRRLLHYTPALRLLGAVLSTPAGAEARDISRDTLTADDGWAAAEGGITGGAAADDAHVCSGGERDLTAGVGWTPTPHGKIDSARRADRDVARGAGAGRVR
jgi:pectate lyase